MIINTLQAKRNFPLCGAALYSFEKISMCATTLFSFIKEEGSAWKVFFLDNFYISKLYSIGSEAIASIAKTIFNSSAQSNHCVIALSNAPIETLESNNRAWIRDHSLLHKSYPHFHVSNEALLDIIFSKDVDQEGVLQFVKRFSAHRENSSLRQSLSDWETAYRQQKIIQKFKHRPQKIEQISRELSQKVRDLTERDNRIILLFEKESTHSNSSLFHSVQNGLQQIKSAHDALYQTLYSNIKEKLQRCFDTSWKKKLFTEIQEEVRAILLDQYSNLYQHSTLGHNIPIAMQQFLSDNIGLSPPEGNESLAAVIWDLFLQNGLDEAPNEPISMEKLNQIFEKEFEMITHGIEAVAMAEIHQFVENAGKNLPPLLQMWHSKLPHKERGWLEITYQSDAHCQIIVYARDMTSPAGNITRYGEPSPLKMYSYNEVPTSILRTEFFFGLLHGGEGEESPLSSIESREPFFSQFGTPDASYVSSSYSTVPRQGLLDHIETYYSQTNQSSIVESPKKTFFQMRFHAFMNYCGPMRKGHNITDDTLSTIKNGMSALLEEATTLYDAQQLSDEEYIAIIATALAIEECVLQKQHNLRAEVPSSDLVVPTIVKEQLRKAFSSSRISLVDMENMKSFAKVLLGNDKSEEIALLCKELPIANPKQDSFIPPYVSVWKIMKDLCVDIKNLRTSPIALFRVYSDVHKLLNDARCMITLLSYLSSLFLCCTNPMTALACIAAVGIALGILYNTPQLEPLLNIYASILNFPREIGIFIFTRLLVRLLQIADIAMHWNEVAPMPMARSFLTENLSRTLSFSLHAPLDRAQENIPRELAPLERFHPRMEIRTDTQDAREISHISFPELSMEFHIREQSGVKRAHVIQQPGFWIADVITDRKLESMDFAHLVLENERGEKKICIVPRSQERLLLQTLLKMAHAYSRKSVDLLSHYLRDQMAETEGLVYYYDIVDGELGSRDCNAISYLITHYMASGDIIRSQQWVDQVKTLQAKGRLENPHAIIKVLEQIASILPPSINSDITKIILELSALCTEIPMRSKAFPLFLRAYQGYVASKEGNHISYLSETEESLLLHHLKDHDTEGKVLNVMGKLCLAAQTALPQTLLLLINNMVDESSLSTLFGKEGYIPTSLKKYQLEREYIEGDHDRISLWVGLMINNLINPYFFLGRDMINFKGSLTKKKGNIFDLLPTILSKLNTENSTVKSDYAVFLCMIIAFASHNRSLPITESMQKGEFLLQAILPIVRDVSAAFLTNPSNVCSIEEKFSGVIQTLLGTCLQETSSNYGVKKTPAASYTRHFLRGGIKTLEDCLDIHSRHEKPQQLRDYYATVFPVLCIGNECESVQILEQSIVGAYQRINNTFLQRQDRASHTNYPLDIPRGNAPEDRIAHIANWMEDDRARAANSFSYVIYSDQTREDLVQRLDQVYETLQKQALQQAKTIEHILTHPPQNLPFLARRVEQYTQNLREKSTALEASRERMRTAYSNQSALEKVGTMALRYINTLLEVPTFGYLQIFKNSHIQLLAQEQSNLLQKSELIQSKRRQLFHSMITACKPQTSLGLQEVYAYFCQGKDISILESLGLDDGQWEILQEQLYRYLILQKHLSCAEYIAGLCTDMSRTGEENINLIGHELDSMSVSLGRLPELEMSARSQLQFERKLGRSMPPYLRNRWNDVMNGSMKNLQSVYQFSCSQ